MKKFGSLLVLLLAVLLGAFGCATIPPDRAALSTLQSVKVSAEAAITVAGSLYSQGVIGDVEKGRAITLYKQIEASSKTAAAALQFATTQGQADAITKDVTDLLVQLQRLIASFSAPKVSRLRTVHFAEAWA
jgi:hypothetical protein